jgi:hypothetical protein
MKIKEAVVERCNECGGFKKEISPEQYGCDFCRKPIEPFGNDERLEVSVFCNRGDTTTKNYYFCSWRCVFGFLQSKKARTDYFTTLPYVSFDNKIVGRRAMDFFALIKKLRNPRVTRREMGLPPKARTKQ